MMRAAQHSLSRVLAIARKELRIASTTWTSYALCTTFFALNALLFCGLMDDFQLRRMQLAQSQEAYRLQEINVTDFVVGPMFTYVATFFIFMLPLVTMRLLAEERRQGGLEFLLATKVSPWEIVVGKFMAASVLMLCMLATTLMFPLIIDHMSGGEVDWNTVACGYLGMALLGLMCVGLGLSASSWSATQLTAALTSFALLLLLWIIGFASNTPGILGEMAGGLSLTGHLLAFAQGLVRLEDITYYVSGTVWGLVVAERMVWLSKLR